MLEMYQYFWRTSLLFGKWVRRSGAGNWNQVAGVRGFRFNKLAWIEILTYQLVPQFPDTCFLTPGSRSKKMLIDVVADLHYICLIRLCQIECLKVDTVRIIWKYSTRN
jgi:hypothetical protein